VSKPTPLFVNLYMYAVNKAAYKVLGRGGLALSRAASEELLSYLKRNGYLPEKPSWEDVKRLFVEELGLADDMVFSREGSSVTIEMRGLKVAEFLKLTREENFEPVACPLASVILHVCEMMCGCRLVLRGFKVLDPTTVRFECATV